MICRPWRLLLISTELRQRFDTYEAKTTSLPHGDMEADPTGSSRRNEPSFPKVGLSNAEAKLFSSSLPAMFTTSRSWSSDSRPNAIDDRIMKTHGAQVSSSAPSPFSIYHDSITTIFLSNNRNTREQMPITIDIHCLLSIGTDSLAGEFGC